MNSRARIASLVLASSLLVATTACSDDDDPDTVPVTTSPPTATTTPPITVEIRSDIVAVALGGGVFTTLAGMVVDAGLVETLRSPGPFTVFAPTDEAFAKVPKDLLRTVQKDPQLLATVLTYHVVPGSLKLADLAPGKLMTVAGVELDITRSGDQVSVNGFPVAAGDVAASNGVIHVMGDVLVPAS